jgi:hypothetical protein
MGLKYLSMQVGMISILMAGAPSYYLDHGRRIDLTPLKGPETRSQSPEQILYFKDPQGRKLAIGKRLIVRFKDKQAIEEYLDRYHLKLLKVYRLGSMYLLEAPTPREAIDAANALSELPEVLFAQPDIATQRRLR